MSIYRQYLESFLAELDIKADTVIDIGGFQNPVRGRTKSWDVITYHVLDLPDYNIEVKSNNFLEYRLSADIVFCLEVFEYLIDPLQALSNISLLLRTNPGNGRSKGKAYISVPLVYPVHQETDLDALRYTENGFKRLCSAVELKCRVAQYRRDKSGLLQAFYSADGMHPAKGIDHSVYGYIFEVTK